MNPALNPVDPGPAPGDLEARRIAERAPRPTTLAQTGLSITFLADLLAKHLANSGVLAFSQLIERLALAGPIVEQLLLWMRKEGRVEVRARAGTEGELRFGLTERGRSDALDAMMRGGYLGPAPVVLKDYVAMVRQQSIHDSRITRESMSEAFRGVVVSDALLDQLGPALNSGRAIFVYGGAGTGKTFLAKRMAHALQGLVLVPRAIAVNETVIQVFDPLSHLEAELSDGPSPLMLEHGFDPRYALCERPIVCSGGELTAEMLEVHCDATTREYNAPLQLKANNGMLLIDDLGRQRIQPEVLFNRWIVPMEEKRDFLTAGPGQHFMVPFDVVLVFSTNLDPQELADDAFLRRIGYKISFKPVSVEQYEQIWADVCAQRSLRCERGVVDYVVRELHAGRGVPLLPCHPRDLLGMAVDRLTYTGAERVITPETLLWAWDNYFVDSAGGSR
jgi:hypothetical protein